MAKGINEIKDAFSENELQILSGAMSLYAEKFPENDEIAAVKEKLKNHLKKTDETKNMQNVWIKL